MSSANIQFAQSDAMMRDIMREAENLPVPNAGLGRRGFLKLAGGAGGGLVLAFCLDGSAKAADMAVDAGAVNGTPAVFNAFVRVAPDNTVTIYSKGPEIGQGIKTAFGLIIAEELDADWKQVTVEQARIDPKVYGYQGAGGSTSIPRGWDQLRQAGAAARAMLVAAAAKQWNVPVGEITTKDSVVSHSSGKTSSYGALAKAAAAMPVPDVATLKLKDRKDWRLLGKRFTGVDNAKLVTGRPLFGIDVQLPGMLYANYTKCPAVGGKVASANLDEIKKLPGVKDAFILQGTGKPAEVMPGVAIIADSTWAAFKAKAALKIEWDESQASKDSTTDDAARAKQIVAGPMPASAVTVGDVDTAFAAAGKTVEAYYEYGFVPHAPLEPQNATGWWHDGVMEIWSPTQQGDRAVPLVATMLGLPEDNVIIHQTRVGGGFGRRLSNDYTAEAAAIALHVKGPVKLQWKREDDFAHDFYRAGGFHAIKGAVDKSGKLSALQNHFVSFSVDGKISASGGDLSVNSFPTNLAPNIRFGVTNLPLLIPTGPWRAPRDNVQMFVQQGFLHELATAAGRDHVEFLLEFLNRPIPPAPPARPGAPPSTVYSAQRATDVVKLLAKKAGWGKTLPKGHGLGIAFIFAYGGHVAEAVELSVDEKKKITVHKVTVVADVGPVVNMSSAENQAQGAALDGLSTAMGLEATFEKGRVSPANFSDYPILRMRSAPPVDVSFIQADYPPSGLGEPGLPALAPALANAIFAATGERVRTLPLKRAGYSI